MTELQSWLDRAAQRWQEGNVDDVMLDRARRVLDERAALLELAASPRSCASLRDLLQLASRRLAQASASRSPERLREARVIIDSLTDAFGGAW